MRAQFERVLAEMRETGFAMVRTPWPFVHEVRAAPVVDEPEVEIVDLSSPDADDALDAFEQEVLRAGKASHEDGDLLFASGEGPETHSYRNTAVHLYMRR